MAGRARPHVEPPASPARLLQGPSADGPELVFALVAATGTDPAPVIRQLRESLSTVGYRSDSVRISTLIRVLHEQAYGPPAADDPRSLLERLMDQGDDLRTALGNGAAAAALAVLEIESRRRRASPGGTAEGAPARERERHATVLRSLKHPDEVRLLRQVYGPRLVVLSVGASRETRDRALRRRLARDHPGRESWWYAKESEALIVRDEKDASFALGQRVRDAFGLADAFVVLRPGISPALAVERLVHLLFGKPFLSPARDEQAMYLAWAHQFRSAASGRQVGAAVVDEDGEVLVLGTNDVPRPGGGQYWPGDDPDHRDFVYGYDGNDRMKYEVVGDLVQRLAGAGWLSSVLSDDEAEAAALAVTAQDVPGPADADLSGDTGAVAAEATGTAGGADGGTPSDRDAGDPAAAAVRALARAGWRPPVDRPVRDLVLQAVSGDGPLAESRVNDLIEFGRIAHAEMGAICTAARRGTALRGGVLYSSTYPCHECARLIIACGIDRVVYIDPYPKSQVPAMYGDQIAESGPGAAESGRVPFVPFEGVAPSLFPHVFAMAGRARDPDGTYRPWDPDRARPRLVADAGTTSIAAAEQAAITGLLDGLRDARWRT